MRRLLYRMTWMPQFPETSLYPENGRCLNGVCSPCGFPEIQEHIPGRILDDLNESNGNEEV